jgi:8-oxo-dGTP diphosphatase
MPPSSAATRHSVENKASPPRWFDLDETWDSAFPEDRDRIRAHVRRLAADRSIATR